MSRAGRDSSDPRDAFPFRGPYCLACVHGDHFRCTTQASYPEDGAPTYCRCWTFDHGDWVDHGDLIDQVLQDRHDRELYAADDAAMRGEDVAERWEN